MDPYQLFHEGKLDEAIDAAIQVVKSKPTELAYRTFLFELLAFKGELERAEKQLDVIGKQHVESEWGAKVYANLLEAERKRRSLFAHGRRPEFFDDPPEYVEDHLKALDFAREGQDDEAAKLLAAAAEKRPVIKVKRGDQEVEGIQDCDDILAPVFEIYILADYCWVPYDSIKELEIHHRNDLGI